MELGKNPERRAGLGEDGKRRAVDHFAWPLIITRHEEIWDELAAMAANDPEPIQGRRVYPTVPFR